jgi:isochorismate pyruvate lyase
VTETPDAAPSERALGEVRSAIDSLDRQIVALIAARQVQVVRAGELKRGQPSEAVRAPARVEQVIGKVRDLAATEGASPDAVEAVYRAMIAAFTTLELTIHQQP